MNTVTGFLIIALSCISVQFSEGQPCSERSHHGHIRLVKADNRRDSESNFEGRVEVCMCGTINFFGVYRCSWGTVCDDYWDEDDARVVCRQLGFSTQRPLAFSDAAFGQGDNLPINMDNVHCTGREERLVRCLYDDGTSDCSHQEDAGVRCESLLPMLQNISTTPSESSVLITWQPPLDLESSVSREEFFIAECFNATLKKYFTNSIVESDQVIVTDLSPSTSYNCCITAMYVSLQGVDKRSANIVNCVTTQTHSISLLDIATPNTTAVPSTKIVMTETKANMSCEECFTRLQYATDSQSDWVTDSEGIPPSSIEQMNCVISMIGGVLGAVIANLIVAGIAMGVVLCFVFFKSRTNKKQVTKTTEDGSQHSLTYKPTIEPCSEENSEPTVPGCQDRTYAYMLM